ncbi:hypothetical protein WUBG_14816, partial [Wuchereria bancrofti]
LFVKYSIPTLSTRNITSSLATHSYINHYNRQTGRGHANDLMHRDLPRFIVANKKISQEPLLD